MGKGILSEMPRLNVFFRLLEMLVLIGIGFTMISDENYLDGASIFLLGIGYVFLWYRERKLILSDEIVISHTGIALQNAEDISWDKIKRILPAYHQITIETLPGRKIELNFRKNLNIDELEQINDFCSQHLLAGGYA